MSNAKKTQAQKTDGLINALSRKNVRGVSKSGSNEYVGYGNLTDSVLRDVFSDDGIGRSAVARVVDDAYRKGFTVDNEKMLNEFSDLNGFEVFREAQLWGRLFGGSLIVMVINDGASSMEEPLNPSRIKSVEALRVYDKTDVSVLETNNDPLSANYEKPVIYSVAGDSGSYRIHASRTIRFGGIDTDRKNKRTLNGWDQSALQPVYSKLMSYFSVLGDGEQIMDEFVIGVLSMKNLMQLSQTKDGEKVVQRRLEGVDETKSNENTVVIDGDGEDYTKHISSISGFSEIMEAMYSGVAGSCVPMMPQTLLFGRSPGGQNSTGDSDIRLWNDGVESYQKNKVLPKLKEFFNLRGDDYAITFNPVYEETPKDKATAFKDYSAGLTQLVSVGVIAPEEASEKLKDINLIYDRDANNA